MPIDAETFRRKHEHQPTARPSTAMAVEHLTSIAEFNAATDRSRDGHPVLINCSSNTRGPSCLVTPEFEKLALDPRFQGIDFCVVDADMVPGIEDEEHMDVKQFPTFVLYKYGVPERRLETDNPSKIFSTFEMYG